MDLFLSSKLKVYLAREKKQHVGEEAALTGAAFQSKTPSSNPSKGENGGAAAHTSRPTALESTMVIDDGSTSTNSSSHQTSSKLQAASTCTAASLKWESMVEDNFRERGRSVLQN
ncbi:hypothetical protein VIGAN_02253700 [Vigna angularis var. angularis]|uniref:Uncharacterized protein n=1 Tax=Vigna angularis var. angularis TaxID=157739 RepID=A0A0S3RGK4_PHAAN|nr:hypothetical protein VIGAN_02253700 [Vigna angularis var. angularis]